MRTVDPAVFRPRPRVESAILGLRRTGPGADPATRELVRAAFAHRRKSLPRSLEHVRPGMRRGGPRGARPSSACPTTRGPRRSPPRSSRRWRRSWRDEVIHAPAKLNLCLYLGPRRADGLHELCSLFEPLALADLIQVEEAESRRGPLRGAGRRREPRRAGAGRAPRQRAGSGPPLRIEIEKRIPIAAGLGGGSADAAAVLRLAAGEVGELEELAAELGADVPSQLVPALSLVRGAGELVERLPDPAPHAVVLLPGRRRPQHRRVFAEADRARPRPRRRRSSRSSPTALRAAAGAGASPLTYPDLLVNDLEPAARAAPPRDRRRPRRPARGRGRARDADRDRADRGRALRGPRRRRARRRARSAATTRSSAKLAPRHEAAGRHSEGMAEVGDPGGDRRRGPRRLHRLHPAGRRREGPRGRLARRSGPGPTSWSAFFAFAETGAFVGLLVPGETVMILGGAVAGQGAINVYIVIGDRLADGLPRRQHQLLHRPAARPRLPAAQRAAVRRRHRPPRPDRRLLLPPRRQDDLHRPLRRLRAGVRPVRRRQLGDALPGLRPLQRPRHRALGQLARSSSATSSRAASTPSSPTPAKAPSSSARSSSSSSGSSPCAATCGSRRTGARRCAGWSRTRATRWIVVLGAALPARSSLFLWERVTPGGTFGLEFTSLMAALAVGSFVLIGYISIVSGDPGPTPGDEVAARSRRSAADRMARRRRQGGHRARLLGGRLPAGGDLRGGARDARGAGPRSGSCWSAWRSSSSASTRSRRRSTGRGRRASLVDASGLLVPERPRRLRDLLRLAGGDGRDAGSGPGSAAAPRSSPPGSSSPRWSASRASTSASTTSATSTAAGRSGPPPSPSARRPPSPSPQCGRMGTDAAAGAPEDRE